MGKAAVDPEMWVLEFLLDMDSLDDALIKHFSDKLACDVGALPPSVQIRLMLRVLRDNAKTQGPVEETTANAVSHCLTFSTHQAISNPRQYQALALAGHHLTLLVKTELVLRAVREPAAGLDPRAELDRWFPVQQSAITNYSYEEEERRKELAVALDDPSLAAGVQQKYTPEAFFEAVMAYDRMAHEALGPPFLKTVQEHIHTRQYDPGQILGGGGASGKKRKKTEDLASGSGVEAAELQGETIDADGTIMPQVLQQAALASTQYNQTYEQAVLDASAEMQAALAHGRDVVWGSPGGQTPGTGSKKSGGPRRRNGRWAAAETERFIELVRQMGKGKWKKVLEAGGDTFANRSQVDLKDKWRNLLRQGIVEDVPTSPLHAEGVAVPNIMPVADETAVQVTPEAALVPEPVA